jgi:hypothetical protein
MVDEVTQDERQVQLRTDVRADPTQRLCLLQLTLEARADRDAVEAWLLPVRTAQVRGRGGGRRVGRSVRETAIARDDGVRGGRVREERVQLIEPKAPVSPRVDAQAGKPALVAPGTDRIGMNPQQPGRLRDGDGRRRELSARGEPLQKEEVVNLSRAEARQTSQNLP